MPVETATYLNDLNPSFPQVSDDVAQGDDHIRLIKSVLQATFPGLSGAATNMFVPVGGIILWSGNLSNIPSGWQLCDGTNGTPNLRNTFVIGADSDSGGSHPVRTTGGSLSHSGSTDVGGLHGHNFTTAAGFHDHGGGTAGVALDVTQIPGHTHTVPAHSHTIAAGFAVNVVTGGGTPVVSTAGGPDSTSTVGPVDTTFTGSGASHNHAVFADGSHQHGVAPDGSTHAHTITLDATPPYFSLAYIQRMT